MKVLSKTSIYAIRALLYMVSQPTDGYISIKEISEKLNISFHFLTKILQSLTRGGLLRSYRGPGGGVSLIRKPDELQLIEVIVLLEGEDFFENCLLGLPGCGTDEPCPVHDFWGRFREELKDKFENTSLEDLSLLEGRIDIEQLRIPY